MSKLLLLLLLSAAVVAGAQTRPATCEVRPLWVEQHSGLRSANLPSIGSFEPEPREGPTVRSFTLPKSDLVITAAVKYRFDYSTAKPRPIEVALAITVSDHEQKDLFESLDSSEGATFYRKKWNLAVTKNISFDNRTYQFTLSCRDGTSRQP